MSKVRHFLKETDFSAGEIDEIFALSHRLKKERGLGVEKPLKEQSWGMLFFKNSTRTRISFDVGIHELGGHGLYLDKNSMQLSRGESVADTAKVVSRYLHGMVIRAYEHALLEEFAREGSIPIVNALTDFLHPCQMYTDAYTIAEAFATGIPSLADLTGRKLVFAGDCASNMANSWLLGGCLMGMEIVLCGPEKYAPGKVIRDLVERSSLPGRYRFTENFEEAVRGADVVYTDVWVSMGDEAQAEARKKELAPYQVSAKILNQARKEAIFMHCLPAHPGEEVSQEVLDSPRSIIFDQAENRLHVQKAILTKLAAR
jgi:ornithine carbamoyltransferase